MAFTFPAMVAWDPNGKQNVKNVSFQVYAVTDTAFTTPLALTDTFNNPLPGNILNSGTAGVFPQFMQAANSTVVITDATHVYAWTVNCVQQDSAISSFINTVGTATQAALSATYAPISSPTFTGTVGGVTKAMVGLGSVDNTADTAKPVSTAQATAIGAKLDSATAATTYAPISTTIPKWVTATAYTAGQQAISPAGDVVSAIANHTSGATFAPANWNYVRFGDYFANVKSFGAAGDGTTDDTSAINAAISYLRSGGRTGGVVFFPIGDYRVTNTIKPQTGTTLMGAQGGHWIYASIGRSRIVMDPSVAAPVIQNVSANATYDANITIEKLYIEGPASAVGHAVHIKGTTSPTGRVLIRDCYITNLGGGQGVRLEYTQTSEIRSCYISNIQTHAVYLYNAFDNLIANNQIDCYKPSDDTVHGNGITFDNSSDNNMVQGNFIFLCDYGIRMLSAHGNQIGPNRINTCNYGMQLLAVTLGNVDRNVIVGNQFYDHGYKGTGVTGIWVDGYSRWNSITGNVASDSRTSGRTQQYGLRLLGNATGNIITGNAFGNNINAGILESVTGSNSVFGNTDGTYNGLNLADGHPLLIGATNGSQIGQSTSKMAFFGATPVVKPSGVPAAATDAATTQTLVNDLRAKFISLGLTT